MSLSQRLRWAVSQVPAKRASGAFDRVLDVGSLPGAGWRVIDQRAWKTGQSGTNDAWAARAREAGLLTAWRSFESEHRPEPRDNHVNDTANVRLGQTDDVWNPVERLSPRSDEGEVCRDEFLTYFEPLFYGVGLVIGVVALVGPGPWYQRFGFEAVLLATAVLARFLMFRPHLVLGEDELVLVGVFGGRRVPMGGVRKAVGSRSGLQLELVDGDKVTVPGHHWRHGRSNGYADLAARINQRLGEASRARRELPPEDQHPSH